MVIVVDVCCLRITKDSISNITARRQLSVMLLSYYLGLNSKDYLLRTWSSVLKGT